MNSMTAFARVERPTPYGTLIWELRTVNHRFFEMSPRLPDLLRSLEPVVRERVQARIGRGKCDATLRFEAASGPATDLPIDQPRLERLLALAAALAPHLGNNAGLRAIDVLRWPGVVREPAPETDTLAKAALAALDETIEALAAMRAREGGRIALLLEQRLNAVLDHVAAVRQRLPEVAERIRERLQGRIAELAVQPDRDRFEQEILFLLQRMDVAEELDRLDVHVSEIRANLHKNEPVGRRLDFLTQELHREANTLGSKSADAPTSHHVVELKVLIEQMREQVQNLE